MAKSRRASAIEELTQSLKAQADQERSLAQRLADWLTGAFGSMIFLIGNIVWFAAWISINTGLIPGIEPFDPFPFSFLTMVVSLEAIVLSIVVLISQNQAAKIADLREETDLQLDAITEKELTKMLHLLCLLLDKHGIDTSQDVELQAMLKPTDIQELEKVLENQIAGEN